MSHPADIMNLQILAIDYVLEPVLFEFGPGGGVHYKKRQTPQDLHLVFNMEVFATHDWLHLLQDTITEVVHGPRKLANNPAGLGYLNDRIRSVINDGLSRQTISTIKFEDFEAQFEAKPEYFNQ